MQDKEDRKELEECGAIQERVISHNIQRKTETEGGRDKNGAEGVGQNKRRRGKKVKQERRD